MDKVHAADRIQKRNEQRIGNFKEDKIVRIRP
jgi:hypothetical protein